MSHSGPGETDNYTHLLFVDEDPSSLLDLSSALSPKGYKLHITSSFEEAREILKRDPIPLVVLDIHLRASDQESCFEFALWLRERSPFSFVDLLFISDAYPARLYRETSLLRYKALEYLDKPISLAQWVEWLEAYERGELPAALSFSTDELHAASSHHMDPEQFLLDPEEWANQVFSSPHNADKQALEQLATEGREQIAQLKREGPHKEHTQNRPPPLQSIGQSKEGLLAPASTRSTGELVSSPLFPPPSPPVPSAPTSSAPPFAPASTTNLPSSPGRDEWEDEKTDHTGFVPGQEGEADPEMQRPTQSLPGFRQGDSYTALPAAHDAGQQTPIQSAHAAFAHGMAALRSQRLHTAVHSFRRALQLQPRPHHRAHYAWALVLSHPDEAQQLALAETQLVQTIQEDPAYEQGYLLLGKLYQHQGRHQEALAVYQRALELHSHFQEVYREHRILQLQLTR